jgi:IS605 OrfB family transposase
MITAYKYKLRPKKAQAHQIDEWLNLLRMQCNYRLSERFNWYESTRSPINSCSLVSCSIAAKQLLDKYDVIGFEDLNVKGLAKTRMAKSILDAGWSEFLDILVCKAESAGKLAITVNPNGTTQNCSNCGTRIPKTIADRWHSCHVCGLELDRDVNVAINVKNLAVGRTVNKAQRVSDADAGLAEKPTLYSSAS